MKYRIVLIFICDFWITLVIVNSNGLRDSNVLDWRGSSRQTDKWGFVSGNGPAHKIYRINIKQESAFSEGYL